MQALKQLGIRLTEQIPLSELLSENFNSKVYGLSPSQQKRIEALRDIVAEYNRTQSTGSDKVTTSPEAAGYLGAHMRNINHEEVWVIFLTNAMKAIRKEMLFKGSLSEVLINDRTIIAKALSASAAAIILAHNHPSGDPTPSKADIKRTESLKKACDTIGISLLDHVIISYDKFYSFADENTYNY